MKKRDIEKSNHDQPDQPEMFGDSKQSRRKRAQNPGGRPGKFVERVRMDVYAEKSERDALERYVRENGLGSASAVARQLIIDFLRGRGLL